MMASYARSDLSNYYRLNQQIHVAINEATKNPVLVKTYNSINARVTSLRFRTNQNAARWKIAVKEHEAMIEALAAHDAAALRDVMVEHLEEQARHRPRAAARGRDLSADSIANETASE